MTLELEDIRPRLFDKAFAKRMDEFRRFRHAFRNVYQDGLDPERLAALAARLPALCADHRPFHARFRAALAELARRVGD